MKIRKATASFLALALIWTSLPWMALAAGARSEPMKVGDSAAQPLGLAARRLGPFEPGIEDRDLAAPETQLQLASHIDGLLTAIPSSLESQQLVAWLGNEISQPGASSMRIAAGRAILAALADQRLGRRIVSELKEIGAARQVPAGVQAADALSRLADRNAAEIVRGAAADILPHLPLDETALNFLFDGLRAQASEGSAAQPLGSAVHAAGAAGQGRESPLSRPLFWDENKDQEIKPLESLEQLGFKDANLKIVSEAAGDLYEKLRADKPKGSLGGRGDMISQRDTTRAWALSFDKSYRELLAARDSKGKALVKSELAALIAYYEAIDFSYGASLDFDPFDAAKSPDKRHYERILFSGMKDLAQKLKITVPELGPRPKDEYPQKSDAQRLLAQIVDDEAKESLEAVLDAAGQVSLPGAPKRPRVAVDLGESGAIERSLGEMNAHFVTEIVLKNQTRRIDTSWRLLNYLKTCVDLNLTALLVGPTGTGKSVAIKWLAAANHIRHLTVAMKPTIGKEEMMGSIRPTSKGLAWQWGFLIKAIVRGDWVTLEEFNLAPTEVLEALNEFLQSGFIRLSQYLDEETLGKILDRDTYAQLKAEGFILRPHPRFRLFLTMNPEFYAGRNKLAQTLMNRTVRIWAPDYSPSEIELILQSRFHFDPERAIQLVENVYRGFKLKLAAGQIGSKFKDKYEFNLRTILRAISLYNDDVEAYQKLHGGKAPDEKTRMTLLGRALWEALGFMMRTETDRAQFWALIDSGLGLNNFGITREDLVPTVKRIYRDAQTNEMVFDEELLPLRIPLKGAHEFVPPEMFDIPPTPQSLRYIYWIARRLVKGEHLLLVGETASGKTTLAQYLHRLRHAALYYTNLSVESSDEELAGGYAPDPANPGTFRFVPGLIQKAGAAYNGKGATLFIDEFNLNTLVEYFNTAQDDRILVTPEGPVSIGPETVFMGAMNPPNYQSRNVLSPASRGRYWEAWIEEPGKEEMTLRMGWLLKKLVDKAPVIVAFLLPALAWGFAPHLSLFSHPLALAMSAPALLGSVVSLKKKVQIEPSDAENASASSLSSSAPQSSFFQDQDNGYDFKDGKRTLKAYADDYTTPAAFSPDGRRIVVMNTNATAVVLDTDTGRKLVEFDPPGGAIGLVAFSPDGKRILMGGPYSVAVGDAATGKALRIFKPELEWSLSRYRSNKYKFNSADISPDGKRVVTATSRKTAIVWDVETGVKLLMLKGHKRVRDITGTHNVDDVESAAFSPDGRYILTVGADKTAVVWDAETGKKLQTFEGPWISASLSPDGKRIITAGTDRIDVWDAAGGQKNFKWWGPVRNKKLHTLNVGISRVLYRRVNSVAFSSDGGRVAVATGADITVFDAASGAKLVTLFGRKGQFPDIVQLAFSPDGRSIVTVNGSGSAVIWDAITGKELRMFPDKVRFAVFSPGGDQIFLAAEDRIVTLWDLTENRAAEMAAEKAKELEERKSGPETGSEIEPASPSAEERFKIRWGWDLGSRATQAGTAEEKAVDWAADTRKWLSSMGGMGLALGHRAMNFATRAASSRLANIAQSQFFQPEDPKPGLVLDDGHRNYYHFIAFSPDGSRIVTAAGDATQAIVWDTATGARLLTLNHWGRVRSVAFSPDGKRIITADAGGPSIIWDANTGTILLQLADHDLACRVIAGCSQRFSREDHAEDHFVLFSPDAGGKRVVTGGAGDAAIVWDAVTGERLLTLNGHKEGVRAASFSPDGRRILTVGWDSRSIVWDAATGEKLQVLKGNDTPNRYSAFSPDGTRIIMADDREISVWDANGGGKTFGWWGPAKPRRLLTLNGLANHARAVASFRSVAFSPDNTRVITARANNVIVWDAATGARLLTLEGHRDKINAAEFSPDGQFIITAGEDKTAILWDAVTGRKLQSFEGHKRELYFASFSPHGDHIATAAYDGTVILRDSKPRENQLSKMSEELEERKSGPETGSETKPAGPSAEEKFKVRWDLGSAAAKAGAEALDSLGSMGGMGLALGHRTMKLAAHLASSRLANVSQPGFFQPELRKLGELVLDDHNGQVRELAAFSPDGNRLLTVGERDQAIMWDAHNGEQLMVMPRAHPGSNLGSASLSLDGTRLATAYNDGFVVVRDIATGRILRTFRAQKEWSPAVTLSPDGKKIVTAGSDHVIIVRDVDTGKELARFASYVERPRSVAFSSDGRRIIIAGGHADSNNRTNFPYVYIIDASTGDKLLTLEGHAKSVAAAAFSLDGKRVVTASNDGVAIVWDGVTGERLLALRSREGWVRSAVFSSDGRRIVTVHDGVDDNDKGVIVWDAATGGRLARFRGPDYPYFQYFASFSPDGKRLVTSTSNEAAVIWDITPAEDRMTEMARELEERSAGPETKPSGPSAEEKFKIRWELGSGAESASGAVARLSSVAQPSFFPTVKLVFNDHTIQLPKFAVFTSDGNRLLTVGELDETILWDVNNGEKLLVMPEGHRGSHVAHVASASVSPDGTRIVTGYTDGFVVVRDVATGGILRTFKADEGPIMAVVFSPNGKKIATGCMTPYHPGIHTWDTDTGKELATFESPVRWPHSVAFSPDGTHIVVSGVHFVPNESVDVADVLDAVTGEKLLTLEGHANFVNSAVFSPDGNHIVTASWDGTAVIWNVATGERLITLKGHLGHVRSAAYSSDGRNVVTVNEYDSIRNVIVWDASTGERLATFGALPVYPLSISPDGSASFSPDGKRVVAAAPNAAAIVWDLAPPEDRAAGMTNELEERERGAENQTAGPSAEEKFKVRWELGSTAAKVEAETWDWLGSMESMGLALSRRTMKLAAHLASNCLANVPQPGSQSTRTQSRFFGIDKLVLKGHEVWVLSAVFTPDGRRIVTTGNSDGSSVVWNAETGKRILTLDGYLAAFSPDGKRIITISWDNTAILWDAETGKPILTLRGHKARLSSAAFSPDGSRVVTTASFDGTAIVWDVTMSAEDRTADMVRELEERNSDPETRPSGPSAEEKFKVRWELGSGADGGAK